MGTTSITCHLITTMVITLTLLELVPYSKTANILALVVTPSPSHHIWNRALVLELIARGHKVTVVSPDPEKNPIVNHTDIVLEGMYETLHEAYDYEAMSQETILQNSISVFQWGIDGCKRGLQTEGALYLKSMEGKQSFDLIIVEAAIDECFLGFVPLFGSPPLMAITAYSNPPWTTIWTANPTNPAYISDCNLPYTDHMTFFQRAANALLQTFVLASRTLYHLPAQEKIARNFFGPSMPPLADIERNISLVLVNTHHSMDYPRPHVPNIIPVGGMHIQPQKPLPKDLQIYLDSAKDGAIFFSLGSNVRSDKLEEYKRNAFLEAFAQLPQKILWKWESDTLPNQPQNVRVGKWLPQNDILAHPNVRLFITHSGLLSSQEAVYHGVPMVGLPFLADQYLNLEKNIQRGVALKLDYNNLTATIVLQTIQKVISDPGYKERMKHLSAKFRDRPQTALNTAVWWTEYVIRHQGAPHLQSAARDLSSYQYLLLDVIGALIVMTSIILLSLYFLICQICSLYTRSRKPKKQKSN